ncbi:hypothetical protein A9K55_006560 [Cordyceps militaris]|uniref:Uncharacterized protein n=1 Tax=Cordyceps militaris TaxID=73501 RepID=A0A2H4SDX2_CORMI|nr:hypothetical protein A9K55_006560 [Cordyceps militaris]
MKLTTVLVAAFAGLAVANPVSNEEGLEKRYTDFNGCMSTCNTPTCAIKNCYQWCFKVCCGQYPSHAGC